LLGRRGQMRAGPLMPLLSRLETVLLLRLLLCLAGVTLPDRLASSDSVLASLFQRVVVLGVARQSGCDAAAERLLLLVDDGRRRLRLVGALTGLVEGRRQLRGGGLWVVVLRGVVEMGTEAVGTRGPRGEGLLVRRLRQRQRLLQLLGEAVALWNKLLSLGGLVSLRAVVVYCQRL
jgi:hypothetical protein